jgi:ATP-dependent RNA helicase RhlE
VEGIAHVVNYDLPQVPEDFIHRVGRTGRAGLRGTASTFSTRSERGEIRKIEQLLQLQLTRRPVPSGLDQEPPRASQGAARVHTGHSAVRSFAPRAKFSRRKHG